MSKFKILFFRLLILAAQKKMLFLKKPIHLRQFVMSHSYPRVTFASLIYPGLFIFESFRLRQISLISIKNKIMNISTVQDLSKLLDFRLFNTFPGFWTFELFPLIPSKKSLSYKFSRNNQYCLCTFLPDPL